MKIYKRVITVIDVYSGYNQVLRSAQKCSEVLMRAQPSKVPMRK
ncbi:hypothetical protein GPAL_3887 [Glaciecola pallidula DSM 14239 = ACAM 615]|uniref:Uncharacterized protein n=1 Tax=Brumicola pallidula DSM 14239 = ACAM 615 TaxID=1121922 RepID=K6ZK50_9ALTE|nr:hypothetical protein GPAL_3887 [Glaciecola pallidula DSM 14239 = ACAM 615]